MRELYFISMYGLSAIAGLFLAFFWTHMAGHQAHKLSWRQLTTDRYFLLAMSFATLNFGLVLIFVARAYGNIEFGLSDILKREEGWFIGAGLAVVLLAQVFMIWMADLEREKPTYLWSVGAFAAVWIITTGAFLA